MCGIHAHSVIRRSRDLTDHAWADYEPKNLVILFSCIMDQPKLMTKLLDFWLFWMERHHIWQHIHVRVPLHQKSFLMSMNGWTRFRWIRKRCVQIWLSIIHMICKHSIECIVKRLPSGPHTPWPNRAEMVNRLFKKFFSALVDTASKNLDKTTLSQITPIQLTRKTAMIKNTRVTLSGKTPMELAMGRRPRNLKDPASMNPEQLTWTPTKQDPLNEEIQKLAMKTHLESQQRENIGRDFSERMKFVPPDLRTGEHVFYWQEDPSKYPARKEVWKMVEGWNSCCQGSMVVISIGAFIFQVNASKLRRPSDTVDLEKLPDSRERTRAPVLWLTCEGQTDVWELFSEISYVSAILWSTRTFSGSPSRS